MLFNNDGFIFLDGAGGTMLQKRGLKQGQRPDIMNITHPDAVYEVARMYTDAGSDIICTNTFGANSEALARTGYTPEQIIKKAVETAKRACGEQTKVALDIGPLGEFIDPLGDMVFDKAYGMFKQQAIAGEAAGADLVIIETMSDLMELKAAVCAVRENTKLEICTLMTFDKTGRTFAGCLPESFAVTAQSLGVSALGINCSLEPSQMTGVAQRIADMTALPLVIKPNAGLPDSSTGLYGASPEEFARQMLDFIPLGVKVVGGCCGTTPEYISALRQAFSQFKTQDYEHKKGVFICSPFHCENIENYSHNFEPAETIDAVTIQSDSGAPILSLSLPDNMTAADAENFVADAREISRERPMFIVTGNAKALSGALRRVCGIAAVCFTQKSDLLTEIAAKYGAVVVPEPKIIDKERLSHAK